MPKRTSPIHRRNFLLLTLFLGAWTTLVVARLIQLQVVEHEDFLRQARRQQEQTVEISPVRGVIYDRNHRPLAMSVEVESVFAVPVEIPDAKSTARLLGKVLHLDPNELSKKLDGDRSFTWVKRKVSALEAARVRQLNLKGVHFQKEPERFYPKRELAAHVLGHVGVDDQGLAGIELTFDKSIRGEPGQMLIEHDARRRLFGRTGRPPAAGNDVVLTLDEDIQYIAEQELDSAVAESHARAGSVVVEDPHTGEILALANWPTFNPNTYGDVDPNVIRNFAVSGIYEPGSTFKIITMASAFDEGDATPDEQVDCQHGVINVAGHTIHDWKAFGTLTVEQAFEFSSDVCAIKLAMRVGNDALYRYIRGFGFGTPTGIELPGETRGMTKPPDRWWKASIGAIAMGQEIGVTPLQMVAAAAIVANDGLWVRPHIVRQSVPLSDAQAIRRVISPQTAARMQRLMERVVEAGTGTKAKPKGYSAAGKTGTAQKLDPLTHTYSAHDFIASFVGFAPAESPQFAMIVVLDSPRGEYHGGTVAAPVFRRIAEQVLAYRDVPATDAAPLPLSLASYKKDAHPAREPVEMEESATQFVDGAPGLVVPNFVGQDVRSVTEKALASRLPIEIGGNGIAFEQEPAAGELLPEGSKISIHFRVGGTGVPVMSQSGTAQAAPKRPSIPAAAAAALPASG
jgi:cell division protein FtsI/penicillin-binding protein 2